MLNGRTFFTKNKLSIVQLFSESFIFRKYHLDLIMPSWLILLLPRQKRHLQYQTEMEINSFVAVFMISHHSKNRYD